jgi:hypothetical protein
MPTKSALAAALLIVALTCARAGADEPALSAIVTTARARADYLAHARIWSDPSDLSPDEILAGPSGFVQDSAAQFLEGVDCTFARPGNELTGKSAKFLCVTSEGLTLRLKYWDAERGRGNREVFATVAATRLMWALGFDALPALPVNVRCHACPSNPMNGEGAPGTRNYVAEISAYPPSGPRILSRNDLDQGWSWRDLDEAIKTLPPGPERIGQRTHFDALTLLGVFMQHGDRKPEQQVLYCAAPVDAGAGRRETAKGDSVEAILRERPAASACPQAAAAIVDVGATLGGAGRTSNETAKMNLEAWRAKTVFNSDDDGGCRGRLTVSLAAGGDGKGNPEISEDGRRFLLDRLHRLSPAHVRAIFTAARVDQLQPSRKTPRTALDEWVAAFDDKVRQIEAHNCRPAAP